MTTLPTLYKTSTTGATQIINMTIDGAVYTREWGQIQGRHQSKSTTATGKNIGRSNETTPSEQALIEANAVWAKKQKANYSTSAAAPVTVNLPMKVSKYQDRRKHVVFPCYVSPKLDGINCTYRLIDGGLHLLSRGGESYTVPAHQHDAIIDVMLALGTAELNGEMYIHGHHLQDLQAAVKKPSSLTPSLIFCVFDFPLIHGTYQQRCEYAYPIVESSPSEFIEVVPVTVVNSHEAIDAMFSSAIANGYEGLIVRNADSKYTHNKRSLDVMKYKQALDAEFLVHGYSLDKNGHIVFECFTESPESDKSFKVKLKGTSAERLAMTADIAVNPDDYIGNWLKIEYETLSAKQIPLKPVGICFRNCDSSGSPLE